MNDVYDKEIDLEIKNHKTSKIKVIDLHGLSLENANKKVKKFINYCVENNFRKIKIITGKGLRSKNEKNPYVSSELNVLKNSVPEFISNESDILTKIHKIYPASTEDGGEGAFFVLLKKFKE